MSNNEMLSKMANTIRFLAADMVQQANSGHPGAPMGLADIAVVLSKYLKQNPKNSKWLNRDRLVFSGGHASSLVYSLLHLWGYDVSIEDLKNFRQTDSKTAGHPEYGHIDGVEITTGPLGQGVANAVGFAMASKYVGFAVNSETAKVIDHKVYCLCGDGDLQEGISYEACAIAGHQNLDNLVLIYDSNEITIEGHTNLAWSEDVTKRFEAQGFDVVTIDGHNYDEIDSALAKAQTQTKPMLIIAQTKIGKGAATKEGSHKTHGAPLGDDEIAKSKELAGFNPEAKFVVDADVKERFSAIEKGDMLEKEWNKMVEKDLPLKEQNDVLNALLNPDLSKIEYPEFEAGAKVATRDSNGKIINAIAKAIPSFIGGSADLAPSNKTELNNMGLFPQGRNIRFGIREHAMAAIGNAMANYGCLIPFTSTFFVFSDYLKPSVRIAALMNAQHYFIWTHDSIGVGEDGPTHEPIEQLSQFRAMPNFYLYRPADATENIDCWKNALDSKNPAGFVCSRQGLLTLDGTKAYGEVKNGGYLLTEVENAQITLMASGSEVELAINSAKELNDKGIATNVVSVPCYDLLVEQDKEYIDRVINPNTKVVAIEAARGLEWYKFADELVCMDTFGASGPANELFVKFGFTVENVVAKAQSLIK
jgi:transketolase